MYIQIEFTKFTNWIRAVFPISMWQFHRSKNSEALQKVFDHSMVICTITNPKLNCTDEKRKVAQICHKMGGQGDSSIFVSIVQATRKEKQRTECEEANACPAAAELHAARCGTWPGLTQFILHPTSYHHACPNNAGVIIAPLLVTHGWKRRRTREQMQTDEREEQ